MRATTAPASTVWPSEASTSATRPASFAATGTCSASMRPLVESDVLRQPRCRRPGPTGPQPPAEVRLVGCGSGRAGRGERHGNDQDGEREAATMARHAQGSPHGRWGGIIAPHAASAATSTCRIVASIVSGLPNAPHHRSLHHVGHSRTPLCRSQARGSGRCALLTSINRATRAPDPADDGTRRQVARRLHGRRHGYDDDDFLDKALEGFALFAFNKGEVVHRSSRALVQESIFEKFMERARRRASPRIKVGRSARPGDARWARRLRRPADQDPRLHRHRQAGRRRVVPDQAASGPISAASWKGLFREADRVHRRQQHADLPGGGLRPGAVGHDRLQDHR